MTGSVDDHGGAIVRRSGVGRVKHEQAAALVPGDMIALDLDVRIVGFRRSEVRKGSQTALDGGHDRLGRQNERQQPPRQRNPASAGYLCR